MKPIVTTKCYSVRGGGRVSRWWCKAVAYVLVTLRSGHFQRDVGNANTPNVAEHVRSRRDWLCDLKERTTGLPFRDGPYLAYPVPSAPPASCRFTVALHFTVHSRSTELLKPSCPHSLTSDSHEFVQCMFRMPCRAINQKTSSGPGPVGWSN